MFCYVMNLWLSLEAIVLGLLCFVYSRFHVCLVHYVLVSRSIKFQIVNLNRTKQHIIEQNKVPLQFHT
jgi:hypothetical protein